jgi:hypothetical protein
MSIGLPWIAVPAAETASAAFFRRSVVAVRSASVLLALNTDVRLSIDNDLAERLLRGIALTRKNFLFLGSDAGGDRAAIIYTVAWVFDPRV